ncbi:MAG: hypothetical protein PHT02_05685 [Tissierellia bacterium]|nr:hypothetical protein [Tissierellia bacterium]
MNDELEKNNRKIYNKITKLLLTIILICLIAYQIPIIWSSFVSVQSEYDIVQRDYEVMHDNFINKNKYKSMEAELIYEKSKLKILNSINQEEIMKIIHEHSTKLGIIINNYNFSEVQPVTLDEEIIENIYMINVNIEFYSSYENLLLFIDSLQKNDINMSIMNLHSTLGDTNYNLVKMDMKFYALVD